MDKKSIIKKCVSKDDGKGGPSFVGGALKKLSDVTGVTKAVGSLAERFDPETKENLSATRAGNQAGALNKKVKETLKWVGDTAKEKSEAMQGYKGANFMDDIGPKDLYKARKSAYASSYDFGNKDTNITPDMKKEAAANKWKRGSAAKMSYDFINKDTNIIPDMKKMENKKLLDRINNMEKEKNKKLLDRLNDRILKRYLPATPSNASYAS